MISGKTKIAPNTPHYALITTVVLIGMGIVGAFLSEDDRSMSLLIGLIITTIPSLIAAGFAERASRDIRNGTITEKAQEGAEKALDNKGVTEAVTQGAQTTPVAMETLLLLLSNQLELDAEEREDLRNGVPPRPRHQRKH